MSTLFAVIDRELMAPALDRCGAALVARARMRALCPQPRVVEWGVDALFATGSEVFPGSSVRGILPVQSRDEWNCACGVFARQLQQHVRNLGWVMEQGG